MTPPGRPGASPPPARRGRPGARGEARRDAVGLGLGLPEQPPPGTDREVVLAGHPEIGAGRVERRQRAAERPAMVDARMLDRDPFEEADDHGRAPAQAAERRAAAVADRLRAGEPAGRQMLHQVQEERQVVLPHPLLVEGEDVGAGGGVQEEVGVLDALGDALVGQQAPDVVGGEKGGERLVGYLGVDGHAWAHLLNGLKADRAPLHENHGSGKAGSPRGLCGVPGAAGRTCPRPPSRPCPPSPRSGPRRRR